MKIHMYEDNPRCLFNMPRKDTEVKMLDALLGELKKGVIYFPFTGIIKSNLGL